MIDFANGVFVKLKQASPQDGFNMVQGLLIQGENVISAYKGIRDYVVFTNKRVISVNVQGVTGKKKDCTSLPYAKITAFSVETAGAFDLDGELDLWFSGLGHVRFEFSGRCDIVQIGQMIASYALR